MGVWRYRTKGSSPGAADRPDIGPERPSKSEGRRTLPCRVRTAAWAIKPVSARLGQHQGEVIMERESIFIGIDVAKEKMDIAVRPSDRTWSTSYDDDDVEVLVGQLQELSPTAVILEATGGIELPLVAALAAASLPVEVVNPRQVRDFAKSTGQLAKTDRLDARVLAHFGEAVRPSIRPLRDVDTQILSAVLARRRQASSIITAEKNRLSRAIHGVSPRIQAHISWLEQEQDDLDDNLRRTVRNRSVWREKDQLLRSFPEQAIRCRPRCWTTCRSWAHWAANRSPPWLELPSSVGTAGPIAASAPYGVAVLAFGARCIWGHWSSAAGTR